LRKKNLPDHVVERVAGSRDKAEVEVSGGKKRGIALEGFGSGGADAGQSVKQIFHDMVKAYIRRAWSSASLLRRFRMSRIEHGNYAPRKRIDVRQALYRKMAASIPDIGNNSRPHVFSCELLSIMFPAS
jgi:hypothetical protein